MRQILKATAIMGSSSLVTILAGIVKNKFLAIMLGPSGIGLIGLLINLQNVAGTIAGMGMRGSGIKVIAAANEQNDHAAVVSTYRALCFGAVFFGLIVAIIMFVFRDQVARLALDDSLAGTTVAWIALGVVALTLANSQAAFLNGLRHIGDLAKINIYRAILGLFVFVIAVWKLQEAGIVIAVISLPLIDLTTSSWYARKIKLPHVDFLIKSVLAPAKKLLSLGFALMVAALATTGTQLLVRVIITKNLGLEATGYFQASWSISMMYLGFVLNAMGTDYFPRLSSAIHDQDRSNALINEQVEVALLLVSPLIAAMIFFAPLVINLLYTPDFAETVPVLQWQLLGGIFRVASWPLGFILLAKGKSLLFLCTEFFWNITYLVFLWFGMSIWGLKAAGIAFLGAYFCYFFLVYLLAHRLNGFAWNKVNIRLLLGMGSAVCIIMLLKEYSGAVPFVLAIAILILMSAFSIIRITMETMILFKLKKKSIEVVE